MEVIAINETFKDGVLLKHCGVLIFKKTVQNNNERWSISLLHETKEDSTHEPQVQKWEVSQDDVDKIFYLTDILEEDEETEEMFGILYTSNKEKKSLIFEWALEEEEGSKALQQ